MKQQFTFPVSLRVSTQIDASPHGVIEVAPITVERVESALLARCGESPRLVFDVQIEGVRNTSSREERTSYATWIETEVRPRVGTPPVWGEAGSLGTIAVMLARYGGCVLVTAPGAQIEAAFSCAFSFALGHGWLTDDGGSDQRQLALREAFFTPNRIGPSATVFFVRFGKEMPPGVRFGHWMEIR